MASSYEVDPDALFSDEEDTLDTPPRPSPKRARIAPAAPRAPSLGHLKLPSYGTANLSRRPTAPPSTASTASYSSYSSHSSNPLTNNPYAGLQNAHSRPKHPFVAPSRPPFARGSSHRPSTAPYNRPNQAPRAYGPPPNHVNDLHRGPMGRGRAATLPAHVTQHNPPKQQLSLTTARERSIAEMASILPEADRERFIQQKLQQNPASATGPSPSSGRKRPSRRRRPDEQSTQKVLANIKHSRKGNFKGLNSLLQAAQNSSKNLIQLEGSKHRMHRPEKAHAVYAEATMTKEMIEREECEKMAREREMEEERDKIHIHFREMREREKDEREWMARKWRKVETVAAGMRQSYRLAKVERGLFGEEEDVKCRTLEYWGLAILPVQEDEKVTELMTIHVEEI